MNDLILETEKLSFFYGSHRGIEDVDLQVKKGEVFGFLGPNGAGKTTALRLFMDVIRPTGGSASIFGLDCQKNGVEVRKRIGYLPGEFNLHPNMNAENFLRMSASLRDKRVSHDYRHQLYQRLDFDPLRKMKTYSRGNKQKIGLIAAFMSKPDLLILDEPTGGLDPIMQHVVHELIVEAKDAGRTTIFSSHILPEVQTICDRVGIIRQGKLIKTNSVAALVNQQFQRLRIRFLTTPPKNAFAIEGIKEIDRSENRITLEVTKNMPALMQKAAKYKIDELQTLAVSLDDIFMTLYTDQTKPEAPPETGVSTNV